MRSRLIKKSFLGLPRTNQRPTQKPRSHLHRFGCSHAAQAFFVTLFASLGVSLTIYWGISRFWYPSHPMAANSVLSRFTSKPPLVDRAILEKIAGLDLEGETDSGTDFSIPINVNSFRVSSPPFRPPRVVRIPETQQQAPPNLDTEMQNRFCLEKSSVADRTPLSCKFLLPLRVAGRGTNAHSHLTQLLGLARALNRTLVLPNVGKNGVGACRRWRFGVYYDEQAFSSEVEGDSSGVVPQDRFRTWVNSLASFPSSQLVSLDWTYRKNSLPVDVSGQDSDGLDISIHDDPDTATTLYNQAGCLNRKFPKLDLIGPFLPLSFVVSDHSMQKGNDKGISRALLERLSGPTFTHAQSEPLMKIGDNSTNYDPSGAHVSPDILIVSWNVPIPILQSPSTTTFPYSPQLRALAARLVRRLGSYIAITWDVETSKSDVVLGCVEALKFILHDVLRNNEGSGMSHIWLAGNLSPSDLLHSPEPLCPSTFAEEPFFASGVKLTGVYQELERMVREGEEVDDVAKNGDEVVRKREVIKDAGVLGILDKLVSMRSTVFVTASETCGKARYVFQSPASEYHRDLANRPCKPSPFTREILDWRKVNAEFFSPQRLGQGLIEFGGERTG